MPEWSKDVSVFEGRLSRTWQYTSQKHTYDLQLFHDTVSGARRGMVDFEEVDGSVGESTIFMNASGCRIDFTVGQEHGYFLIKSIGWFHFVYQCVVEGTPLTEMCECEAATPAPVVFEVNVDVEVVHTTDQATEDFTAWHLVHCKRVSDNVTTNVHRRFKHFAKMNSAVKQNLKGNDLYALLPTFPEKTWKMTQNHMDSEFLKTRCHSLEFYLKTLLAVPHVADMPCVKKFLGLMDHTKELSFSCTEEILDFTCTPGRHSHTPVVVGNTTGSPRVDGLLAGDVLFELNGVSCSDMTYNDIMSSIKFFPRPFIAHFIQSTNASKAGSSSISLTTNDASAGHPFSSES